MGNIDRYVTSLELKKRLGKGSGIGTPAMRSSHIKNLLKSGLLQRQKISKKSKIQYLVPSELAKEMIDAMPKMLSDPGFAALLEAEFEAIKEGRLSPDVLTARIKKYITAWYV